MPKKTIRPAPGNRMVAFVTKDEELMAMADDTVRSYVVPTESSVPAMVIDERTGEFPDWTADGRPLVYFSVCAGKRPTARTTSRGPRGDAFTYVKRIGSRNEYILHRDGTEVVLSRNWPAEMLWRFPED